MKKQMIKFAILIISVAILLIATNTFLCSSRGMAPEVIDVKDIKILELKSDSLKLKIKLLALNKNNSDIKIEDLSLDLMIDNDIIGSVFESKEIEMKKFDTTIVSISTNLSTIKAIQLASEKNDTLNLKLKGAANADLGLIGIPVKVDLQHKFNFRKKLTETIENDTKNKKLLKVQAAKIKSLGLGNSTVEVEYTITNPYGLDITLRDYHSHIHINENESGEGNIASKNFLIKEKSTVKGLVIYKLNNVKTISSLFGSILKKRIKYRTSGMLQLIISGYSIQFPFNFEGDLISL